MQLMRSQTQLDYRTRILKEETQHVKKSRMKLGKELHVARETRVGHPCYRGTNAVLLPGNYHKHFVYSLVIFYQDQTLP